MMNHWNVGASTKTRTRARGWGTKPPRMAERSS
jgi:hypothetical protein